MLARIRSVEQAYWELRAAISSWQILGTVIPLSEEIVRIEELRLQAKRTIYSDLARARVNLESLRRRRASTWNEVRSSELVLRELLAMPASDQVLLMPSDMPNPTFEPVDATAAAL